MSDWIATPKGAYIAEEGGYLMCVDRGMSSQVYAYNTIRRDGTYNRAGDGYPDAKSAMVAAEKAMREHRDVREAQKLTDELNAAKVLAAEWEDRCKTLEDEKAKLQLALADWKSISHDAHRKVTQLEDELRISKDYAAGPTWDSHREVVARLEKERDSWQAAHRLVFEREKAAEKERNELSFKLEQTEKTRAYHAVAADKHMDSLRRIAGMLDVPAGERGVHGVIENAVYALKTAQSLPELKMLRKIVDDAWAATGVASTVRGLTDLADVIQTIRKERDEWSALAKNHATRVANLRKALDGQ